jgi:hypothetical protein
LVRRDASRGASVRIALESGGKRPTLFVAPSVLGTSDNHGDRDGALLASQP